MSLKTIFTAQSPARTSGCDSTGCALMHYTHGNLDIQEPLETRRSACLILDVPLPVVVLNEYVRKHFSMLMELSDSVSLSNAGGRLRIKCTVCGLWEE